MVSVSVLPFIIHRKQTATALRAEALEIVPGWFSLQYPFMGVAPCAQG
jgi:hypothetical protein